jgi:hypothetical protein
MCKTRAKKLSMGNKKIIFAKELPHVIICGKTFLLRKMNIRDFSLRQMKFRDNGKGRFRFNQGCW